MPPDTGTGADQPGNANVGDTTNAGAGDIDARVNRIISARFERFEKKLASLLDDERLGSVIEKKLEALVVNEEAPKDKPAADSGSEQQKMTVKALHEELTKMRQSIEAERKRADGEAQKARDVRLRSEVHNHFARHLGADSPHLKPYVNEWLSQFSEKDGGI